MGLPFLDARCWLDPIFQCLIFSVGLPGNSPMKLAAELDSLLHGRGGGLSKTTACEPQ